jgi:excisionase family DNA binding protein
VGIEKLPLYTLREAAAALRVSHWTVRRWIIEGRLDGIRLHERGAWRVSKAALRAFPAKGTPTRVNAPQVAPPSGENADMADSMTQQAARGQGFVRQQGKMGIGTP